MVDYGGWEQSEIGVTAIALDAKNPRLSELGHEATEREIIAQLIQHEDVYELAKQISQQGFYPTEVLVCVEEGGELRVVEGNRRLASLKLLLSPTLAPSDKVAKITKLASSSVKIPRVIPVVVAPSRSATIPLIMNRHNKQGVKGWNPVQQAKYVNSVRDSGMSIENLAAATGFTSGEVLNFIRTNTMYEIACKLPLSAKVKDLVRDPRKFNTSTLERVIGSRELREFLGIAFDRDGEVNGSVPAKEFTKAYQKIITDIANGVTDTRKLNNAKLITAYIKTLEDVKPDRSSPGTFTSVDLLSGVKKSGVISYASPELSGKKIRSSPYLIPKTFKCYLGMPRISEILDELQRLRVDGFENAVAVELRIFIELSISHYLESTGMMKPLVARLDKKNNKPNDWTPSLRHMLLEVLANDSTLDIPRQARKALDKAVADDGFPLSLDGIDQFVHNPYVSPTDRQLRQYWSAFEKLLTHMMVDHSPAVAP